MRILFVVQQLTNGGAERIVVAFANTLAQLGEDVHIACINDAKDDYAVDPRVGRHLLRYSSNVHIPKVRGLCNIMGVVRQMRKLSGDVIIPICPLPEYYIRFRLATLFSKTRLVYAVVNNQEKQLPKKKDRRRWNRACFFADGIWIQTEKQREYFPKYMQKKIFEVHNIIDERFLNIPGVRREKICNFISVGRLHAQKNHKMMIESFARLVERTGNRDATLTIYGKTGAGYHEVRGKLEALIRGYQLEDRVFLPGRVADIETKYAEADAFVLSSDYEGCPNALMEAMAAGLPCISTDCPTGPSMLIENGRNGQLVPVGDVEAMSLAMESLIDHPRAAGQMGIAAKQTMIRWGSAEELAGQLLTHLKRICS